MLLDLVAKPTFVYDFKRLSVGRSLIDSPAFRARRSSYPLANRRIRARETISCGVDSHPCFQLRHLFLLIANGVTASRMQREYRHDSR